MQSLFDRLSIIYLEIPPVNLRREDILPICDFYLNYYNKNKKFNFTFSDTAKANFNYMIGLEIFLKSLIMLKKQLF